MLMNVIVYAIIIAIYIIAIISLFFSEAIKELKSMGVPVPAGFKINVTDHALFDACKIPLPEMCKSQLQWSNRLYP